MKRLNTDLYSLIQFGLGEDSWQEFIERYEEKYNNVQIDGFDFEPTKLGYTWNQLIASLNVATLPSYVDPESPGYEKALQEVNGLMGNIPTQKAFYSLNRVTVREKMMLVQKFGEAALTSEMQNVMLGMLDESSDGLIGGYYNSLTNQRMQIVSTGQFTINATNNPRGLKGITIDFGIDASHFDTLTTTARWWTNSGHTTEGTAADPILYMKNRIKAIRNTFNVLAPMQVEMSKKLYDDMLTHSKVLEKIGYLLYPAAGNATAAQSYAQNLSDDALTAAIERLINAPIKVRDTYAYVNTPNATTGNLDTTQIENFNALNIAFVPQGKLGGIQGVEPLTLGYEADKVARYNDGRLILTQRAEPQTHSIYIESEAAQLCVPSVPQYMFISTVTA